MNYLKMTTVEILKERFKQVQSELKQNHSIKHRDFREYVFKKEPIYNCPVGFDKIQNAWFGRTPDLRLTELIQEFKTELA